MKILFITRFSPLDNSSGSAVRSGFLWRALQRLGDVRTTVIEGLSPEPDDDVRKIRYRPKASAWPRFLTPWYCQAALFRLGGERVCWLAKPPKRMLVELGWPGESFDCVVARYVRMASRFAAWRIAPLVLDVDDLPTRDMVVRGSGLFRTVKRRLKTALLGSWQAFIASRAKVSFIANSKELGDLPECTQRVHLPNVAPEPPSGYAFDGQTEPLMISVGVMEHLPNALGVDWFVTNVWPAFHAAHPEMRYAVIGRDAPEEFVARWRTAAGVEVVGYVKDLLPWYARACAVVSPVLEGSGTSVKVPEACLHGRPVLATHFSARDLSEEDCGALDIAFFDSADSFGRAYAALSGRTPSEIHARRACQLAAARARFGGEAFCNRVKEALDA